MSRPAEHLSAPRTLGEPPRSWLENANAGLKIFLFIMLSLALWVLIAFLAHAAYDCLPPVKFSLPPGQICSPGSKPPIDRVWYLLVLPFAMLIAGLWIWPEDKQPRQNPGKSERPHKPAL